MNMKKILRFIYLCVLMCLFSVSCKKAVYENDGHEHRYSEQWSYDDNYHWKKAICSGSWDCNIRISQKGSHKTDNWVPDVELINTTGKMTEKVECSLCGKKATRESEYPVFEAIDSEGQGVRIRFYLPNNTHQITINKSSDDRNFTYYSRISTWTNDPLQDKEIIWNDPYVQDGKDYYYTVQSAISDNGFWKYSNSTESLKVRSNGGKGELWITNTPEGHFDEATNTLTFSILPEYSVPECKTRLLFYTARNNLRWSNSIDHLEEQITWTRANWPFQEFSEMDMKSFGITGDITYSSADHSWPYSGAGEVFYRTMEGGIILDKKEFTWKQPE